jgi:HAMP domain-containing protein/putative methionine-R-sulfoxide reductase with GAF domain
MGGRITSVDRTDSQLVRPTLGRNLSLVLIPLVVLPSIILLLLALIRIQSQLRRLAYEVGDAITVGQTATLAGAFERQIERIQPATNDPEFLAKVELFLTDPEVQANRDDLLESLEDQQALNPSGEISAQLLMSTTDGTVLLATDPSLVEETVRIQGEPTGTDSSGLILAVEGLSASPSLRIGVYQAFDRQDPESEGVLLASLFTRQATNEFATQLDQQARADSSFASHDRTTLIAFPPDLIYQVDSSGAFSSLSEGGHPLLNQSRNSTPQPYSFVSPSGQTRIGASLAAFGGNMLLANDRTDVTLLESLGDFLPVLVMVFLTLGLVSSYIIYQMTNRTLQPLTELSEFATRVSRGEWDYRVDEDRQDELGQLATSLNQMAQELGALYQSLEDRVEERTKQIRTASEVARGVISIPNLDELLRQAVQLIKDRFGYDHVSIFLLDSDGKNAVLRETTTSGDEGLKTIGHRLPVGSASIVGQVTMSNQPKVATGNLGEQNSVLDELLPGARSEVAIPLQITGKSLGALAIQSFERDAFQREDIEVLQTLADQLSAAIENARLAQASTNAAERARLVSEITGQISGLMDPEHVLRTTAQALHRALGDAEVEVRLTRLPEPTPEDYE